jgi:O-antigen ligase
MDDASKLYLVVAAVTLAIGFFLFTYFASPRKTVPLLIWLSPFQTIDTPYTTSSVMLTYVVGIAYIFRGKLRFLPMLGIFLAIMAVYVASTGFAHRNTWVPHALYMFNFGSAILMFYVVYNFVRETKDVDLVIRTLIILNILVVIYSIIQVNVGPRFALFGIPELSIQGARGGGDPRLRGPYGVGITAELFVLSILLFAYLLIHVKSAIKRNGIYLLMALNLGCLIATANRGGFLSLIGGAGLFLIMYRSTLGVKRTMTLTIAGVFLIAIMSVIVVNYTQYGQMYDRLEATEFEEGLPDSRARAWSNIVLLIAEKPLLGHGPMLRLGEDTIRPDPETRTLHYPHNVYLFLLYTVGVFGLIVYLVFFAWLMVRFRSGIKQPSGDPFIDGFIKLGILSLIVFLIDQIKVEFLRFEYIDYWHYTFSVFAIWLAFADMSRSAKLHPATTESLDASIK